ncbi:MAG TPA: arsenic transporter [Terracidiphilus sp.]|nr:arsenic transporter [Terracidiphilus sp.]
MLLRPRGAAEVYWACGGALLLVIAGLLPVRQAIHAALEGWEVYLFLAGMMVLAEMAREEGVFDWAAGLAAGHARGSPRRLFALVYLVGVVVTAFLSNDATAVVLTPAVLAVVRRARISPRPHLLACAFVANAASFIFPISNPANLVVFGRHMPPLLIWLETFLLPASASVAITYLCLSRLAGGDLRGRIPGEPQPAPLTLEGRFALGGLLLAAVALIASSALGIPLGAPTCGAALLAMCFVVWRNRGIVKSVAGGVAWSVLPLVAGLFVIVEALHSTGLLRLGLEGLQALAHQSVWLARFSGAFTVGLLSNGMNNLPVALMCGAATQLAHNSGIVTHALLIGVDLGPNLSVTGSLATILWLIALRRDGVEITAREFFGFGVVVMPVALTASLLLLWR